MKQAVFIEHRLADKMCITQIGMISIRISGIAAKRQGKRSKVQATSSLGRHCSTISISTIIRIFNPRSREGAADSASGKAALLPYFNPRSPRGGATGGDDSEKAPEGNFNPRSPRGSDRSGVAHGHDLAISIHAPRGGSDCTVKACSNDRIKRSTLREPHFFPAKNAYFSPNSSMCATTSRTKNQRIIVSFGSYPGLAPMCFTLDWYRFPRL